MSEKGVGLQVMELAVSNHLKNITAQEKSLERAITEVKRIEDSIANSTRYIEGLEKDIAKLKEKE